RRGPNARCRCARSLARRTARVRKEPVAEDPGRAVGHEAVLAVPAGAVARVECVDVDEPPVAVERTPEVRCVKAVDRLASVDQRAVEKIEAAVGPNCVDRPVTPRPRPGPGAD